MKRSHFLKLLLSAAAVMTFAYAAEPAFSWGAPGHEYVGAIADQLIGPRLQAKVAEILGPQIKDLRTAGPWADCVRSVVKQGDKFVYAPDPAHPEYTANCHAFETPEEKARMEDYAARNWTDCDYKNGGQCHAAYHFADIAVQRNGYDVSETGANDHDVVHAINACIKVLEGQPAPAPFSFKDKKEALLLLAHFVGDETQPLHVASVYLDANGALVDPDAPNHPDLLPTETFGGNSIHDHGHNFHSEWDDIPADWVGPTAEDLTATRLIPPTTGPIDTWAAQWATQTVVVSHRAFAGLAFGPKVGRGWEVTSPDDGTYAAKRFSMQRTQLQAGGAHLAQLVSTLLN